MEYVEISEKWIFNSDIFTYPQPPAPCPECQRFSGDYLSRSTIS